MKNESRTRTKKTFPEAAKAVAEKVGEVVATKVVPIVGAVAIAAGVAGCKLEPDDNPPPKAKDCNCIEKEHLGINEDCNCGADANLCDCILQVYGELFAAGPKIYRSGNVSAMDMVTAVANARAAYIGSTLGDTGRELLEGKIDEIHIIPITSDEENYFYRNQGGKLILGVKIGREGIDYINYFTGRFTIIGNGSIQPTIVQTQQPTRDIIKLAKEKVDAKAIGQEVAFQAVGDGSVWWQLPKIIAYHYA